MCALYLECDKLHDFCLPLFANFRHPSPNQQGCSPKSDSHLSWNLVFSVLSPKSLTTRCAKANTEFESGLCKARILSQSPLPECLNLREELGFGSSFGCAIVNSSLACCFSFSFGCFSGCLSWGLRGAGAWCHGWIILVQLQVHERFGTMIA